MKLHSTSLSLLLLLLLVVYVSSNVSTPATNTPSCASLDHTNIVDAAVNCIPAKFNNLTAYVTLVSGSSISTMGYVIGALALGESLANADPGRRRLCMVTPETYPSAKAVLVSSGLWEVFEADAPKRLRSTDDTATDDTATDDTPTDDNPTDAQKLAHTFTKLRIFDSRVDTLAQLDIFVFIDADAFVRQNQNHPRDDNDDDNRSTHKIASLFERDQTDASSYPIAAAQNIPLPRCVTFAGGTEKCYSTTTEFNTGVLRIVPGPTLYKELRIYDMLYRDATSFNLPWEKWSTDQAVLNELLDFETVRTLHVRYNTLICCSFYDTRLIDAASNAVIAHFSLSTMFKPWEFMRYERIVMAGERTTAEYISAGVVAPFHLPESIHHDVYMEWKNFAEAGMLKLGDEELKMVEAYILREKDYFLSRK